MQAWLKLGSILSKYTVWLILAAVTVGILFPQLLSPLRPYVPVLFAFAIFQSALGVTFRDLKQTASHPLPMVIVIVYAHLAAPIVAWILGNLFFGYDPNIVTGIVLEYSVPVAASMVMWVSLYSGNVSAALTTLLISTVIAPFTIPATLQVFFGATVEMDPFGMMRSMLFTIALPAVAGLLVNEATKGWASRTLSDAFKPATRLLIPLIVGTNCTAISDYVLHLTPELFGVLVFILCFATGCFFAGIGVAKLMHQPDDNFITIMYGCGMRNITAGAVIAAQYFPAETIFPVIAGTLFQQILASIFGPLGGKLIGRPKGAESPADSSAEAKPEAAR